MVYFVKMHFPTFLIWLKDNQVINENMMKSHSSNNHLMIRSNLSGYKENIRKAEPFKFFDLRFSEGFYKYSSNHI